MVPSGDADEHESLGKPPVDGEAARQRYDDDARPTPSPGPPAQQGAGQQPPGPRQRPADGPACPPAERARKHESGACQSAAPMGPRLPSGPRHKCRCRRSGASSRCWPGTKSQREKVADQRRERERRRLEVQHEGHAVARVVVPQRELAVVHGQPVERVPGHRLGDDVAVQAVVDGKMGHVGQERELVGDVGRAEGKAVLQRGRQVGAQTPRTTQARPKTSGQRDALPGARCAARCALSGGVSAKHVTRDAGQGLGLQVGSR